MLLDVPSAPYAELWVEALAEALPLEHIRHIVVTHLSPQAIKSLELLMKRMVAKDPNAKPLVYLTNPALRLLQASMNDVV